METLEIYPDGTYRRYLGAGVAQKQRTLHFEELSQTDYNTIEAFFIAQKMAVGTNDQFYVYDPNAVNAPDLSGVSTTGRHTAIFIDNQIDFTRDAPCEYSGDINVLFLN